MEIQDFRAEGVHAKNNQNGTFNTSRSSQTARNRARATLIPDIQTSNASEVGCFKPTIVYMSTNDE